MNTPKFNFYLIINGHLGCFQCAATTSSSCERLLVNILQSSTNHIFKMGHISAQVQFSKIVKPIYTPTSSK